MRIHFRRTLILFLIIFPIKLIASEGHNHFSQRNFEISVPEFGIREGRIPPFYFDGNCKEQSPRELKYLKSVISNYSGKVLDVESYAFSIDGFEAFISDSGIVNFPIRELVELPSQNSDDEYEKGRRRDALSCGLNHLMPPRCR